MKYYRITFNERNGEQEYYHHSVIEASNEAEAQTEAEKEAQNWYDIDEDEDEELPEKDEHGEYYHLGGCIAVSVEGIQEIPEDHYNILKQYV